MSKPMPPFWQHYHTCAFNLDQRQANTNVYAYKRDAGETGGGNYWRIIHTTRPAGASSSSLRAHRIFPAADITVSLDTLA